jgi:hypothetical protein
LKWRPKYRRFLFAEPEGCERLPLGIYDSLCLISDFISTLDLLWDNRTLIRFPDYESFWFSGLGLLSGMRRGSQSREAILAYCGGVIPGKGKCGYSPLVKGSHETCRLCGKLICPKCGYCEEACRRRGMSM